MRSSQSRYRVAAGLVAVLGLVSGCFSGSARASADDLESAGVSAVQAQIGREVQMDCGSQSVAIEVGASAECDMTVQDDEMTRTARVSIASVTDEGYTVDVTISPAPETEPTALTSDELERKVSQDLTNQTQASPTVICAEGLAREVGAVSTCQARFAGEDTGRSVTARVQSVAGDGSVGLEVRLSPTLKQKPLSEEREAVAAVAADALEPQLGQRPRVDCGEGFVQLRNETRLWCAVTSQSGEFLGNAQIVLKDVTGISYGVSIALEQNNENEEVSSDG